MIVFKPGDAIYHSKVLTFYRGEPFALQAEYAESANMPLSDPKIGENIIDPSLNLNICMPRY